ncbi:MAG TPA: hypothetical protein V6C81_10200 [Planktothrix sp.]|jgi:hypothetical protein
MPQQRKEEAIALKKEVQKRYQEELSRYQKQIEKNKKLLVRRSNQNQ